MIKNVECYTRKVVLYEHWGEILNLYEEQSFGKVFGHPFLHKDVNKVKKFFYEPFLDIQWNVSFKIHFCKVLTPTQKIINKFQGLDLNEILITPTMKDSLIDFKSTNFLQSRLRCDEIEDLLYLNSHHYRNVVLDPELRSLSLFEIILKHNNLDYLCNDLKNPTSEEIDILKYLLHNM